MRALGNPRRKAPLEITNTETSPVKEETEAPKTVEENEAFDESIVIN